MLLQWQACAKGKSNNHYAYFYPSVTGKIEYGCGVFLQFIQGAAENQAYLQPSIVDSEQQEGTKQQFHISAKRRSV